jgi:hypothetical protein
LTLFTEKLELSSGAVLTSVAQNSSPALRSATRQQLAVTIAAQHITIAIDGTPGIQAAVTVPDLTASRVVLGVTTAGSEKATEVRFANLEVHSSW